MFVVTKHEIKPLLDTKKELKNLINKSKILLQKNIIFFKK